MKGVINIFFHKFLYKLVLVSFVFIIFSPFIFTPFPAFAQSASAQSCEELLKDKTKKIIILQSWLPGLTKKCTKKGLNKVEVETSGKSGVSIESKDKTYYYVESMQEYIVILYKLFMGLVSFAAVFMLMLGGAQYIIAGGNQNKISTAKSMISGALSGLFLAISSYVLLATINPRLVTLEIAQGPSIEAIERSLFCSNLEENNVSLKSKSNNTELSDKDKAKCGEIYTINDNEKNFCIGDYCENADDGYACIGSQGCQKAGIYGSMNGNNKKVAGNFSLNVLCEDIGTQYMWAGEIQKINKGVDDKKYYFKYFTKDELENICRNNYKIRYTNKTGAIIAKALFFVAEIDEWINDYYMYGKPCGNQSRMEIQIGNETKKYHSDISKAYKLAYEQNKDKFIIIDKDISFIDGGTIEPYKCDFNPIN